MTGISISFHSPPLTLASVLERHSVGLVERFTKEGAAYLRLTWRGQTVALYRSGNGFYREVGSND